ncbi:terminase [Ottowia sp.]|uniref:terminase n=1 Tax=Ottowia sp. TaxID=1898956 RepID=UPI003A890D4B
MAKLTTEKIAAFCAALSDTGGNVSRACKAVDISRQIAYQWRDLYPEFATAWEKAKAQGMEALEDEANRRAFEGFDEPVVYQGAITDTVKKYSDTLLIFLLKGGKPEKYRERAEISGPGGGPIEVSDTERAARLAGLMALAQQRAADDPDAQPG